MLATVCALFGPIIGATRATFPKEKYADEHESPLRERWHGRPGKR
jgi:hypothetical protein